jgi:hypothetical protein
MEAEVGMLVVETIANIRRAYFVDGRPIGAICREFDVSRKVVRKVIRSQATEFRYERESDRQCQHEGPAQRLPDAPSGLGGGAGRCGCRVIDNSIELHLWPFPQELYRRQPFWVPARNLAAGAGTQFPATRYPPRHREGGFHSCQLFPPA